MSLKYDCACCPIKSANCAFGRMRDSVSCHQLLEQFEEVQLQALNSTVQRLLKETKEVRKEFRNIANNDTVEQLGVAINCFHAILNEEEEEL